jgi:E3 ubiquitin-protein ligase CBL
VEFKLSLIKFDFSYLYPDGQSENVDLSGFFNTFVETRIHVDSEQQRLYSAIGTTYELCKICDERDKNVRLEPCDHLLCSVCLKNWQDCSLENSTQCPFCREPIRGTEGVVIRNPYSRNSNQEDIPITTGD